MSDAFDKIRQMTPARVALGRTGAGLTTKTHLEFQFAHARARDAVHREVDFEQLEADLNPLKTILVQSAASDRATYLRRPDLGRKLSEKAVINGGPFDLVFVVADGLSSDAVQIHAPNVIKKAHEALRDFSIAPIYLAKQSRVALGDQIGQMLGAKIVILLVGERPGLTVADSLGVYITFCPKTGIMDSQRNCISNIHGQGGLSVEQAVFKINWLVREALKLGLTGTGLKENAIESIGTSDEEVKTIE